MVLTCVSFLLCGCTGEEYVQHAKSEAGCDEDFTLDYYIWSDEETYVRKVVEAWNALQGREAVRLYVIPNDEHDDWVENYGESVGGRSCRTPGKQSCDQVSAEGISSGTAGIFKGE